MREKLTQRTSRKEERALRGNKEETEDSAQKTITTGLLQHRDGSDRGRDRVR